MILYRMISTRDGYTEDRHANQIMQFTSDTTYADNSVPIPYWFITKWYDFGNSAERKKIQRMVAVCEKQQGLKIYYQTDENDHWIELGQARKYMTDFDQLNIRFHRIRFKVRGISSSEPFIFREFQIVDYQNEGIII